MGESTHATAQEWDGRWQHALVQASGPSRTVSLTRGDLLKTSEGGLLAVTGAADDDEVALGDAAVSVHEIAPPLRQRGTDSWLRWLTARASTLQERLDRANMATVVPADERLVQARLQRWAAHVTTDNSADTFERYLLFEGLDSPASRRAVSPAQLCEDVPLPDWAATAGEALFSPCYDALPGVSDPVRPLPFETLLLPFLHVYLRRMEAAAPAVRGRLSPAARRELARNLLVILSITARDALYAEFCRYRLAGFAPLAPFVSSEPNPLYRGFIGQMQAGGLIALIEAYPILGRRLAMQIDLYAAAVGEFLRRLEADLPEICQLWGMVDPGPVTGVVAGLSDPHRGGRQVYALTFADGSRLIYKPKDLGIDVAYNGLLAWLNAAGAPVTLRPLRVLDRQTHGWVECVEPAACADRAAIARYYQRAGALACLVYILQGSDCHAENLIAAGEDPVLVDCETLLVPWPRAADRTGKGDRARARTNRLVSDSVLITGLLPSLGDEDERTFSIAGFCRAVVMPVRKHTNRWMLINTDRMAISQVAVRVSARDNLPRLEGVPAEVGEYVEPLAAGFAAMYRFLIAQRHFLLAPDGPLAAFRGRFLRFVLRLTHLYRVLSWVAMRPAGLSDGAEYSLYFELLARALLAPEQMPASWPIVAAERTALLRGDVPFFGAYTDQTALLLEDGRRIDDYFVRPSYDAVQDKLRNLSEQDLAFQLDLIRAAVGVYVARQERAATLDLHHPAEMPGRAAERHADNAFLAFFG